MPDERQDDPHWYPSAWQESAADPFPFRGIRVVLEGGPLDGRTGHLTDDSFALWVAQDGAGQIVVTGAREAPDLPDGYRSLGVYRYIEADETLRWTAEAWD